MNTRLTNLRTFLREQGVEAVVVNKPENMAYFSGFAGGEGMLVITASSAKLVTDFRFMEQAAAEAKSFELVKHEQNLLAVVAEVLKESRAGKIGFEGDWFTYNEFSMLTDHLREGYRLKPLGLDRLRSVKDEQELAYMKKAVEISDAAFAHILTVLKPGISEMSVAAELEDCMRKLGSEKPAFDTIVVSGERGSLPHGLASAKLIDEGDLVTMDFGAVYHGYHSDITRTVCIGKANEKQRHIYEVVLAAQLLGLDAIKIGSPGKMVDNMVRRYIADAGYGKFFGHGLGHGAGLAIHELPRLSPSSTCEGLEENMIVTVEPGIYLPGWGGVRIEDTVVVGADGAQILTKSSKAFIEIK